MMCTYRLFHLFYYQLYFQFIKKFEARLSQMCLARLVSRIGHLSFAPNDAISFFIDILQNRERLGVEASMYLDIDVVEMQLKLGQLAVAKNFIDDTKEKMQQLNLAEASVFSKFYKVLSEYHKVIGIAPRPFSCDVAYDSFAISTPSDRWNCTGLLQSSPDVFSLHACGGFYP